MKKLLIISALVLVFGLGGLLLFGLNPIVAGLKPELLRIASMQVGQPVEAKKISVSVIPEIAIELSDLSVGPTASPVGTISKLELKTSIFKLLSSQIGVTGIRIVDPLLKLTRHSDGSISLGELSLTKPKRSAESDSSRKNLPQTAGEIERPQSSQISFNLTEGEISNGTIQFNDQSVSPNQTISLSNLNLSVSDLGAGASPFSLSAGLFGKDNISLSGKVNLAKKNSGVPEIEAKLKVTSLALSDALKTAGSYGVKLPLELKESLALELSYSNIGNSTAAGLVLDLTNAGINYAPTLNKAPAIPLKLALSGSVAGPVYSAQSAMSASGTAKITIDSSTIDFDFKDAGGGTKAVKIKSSKMDLATLRKVAASLNQYGLGGAVTIDLNIPHLDVAGTEVPDEVSGNIIFADVAAAVPLSSSDSKTEATSDTAKALPIKSLNGEIRFDGSKITAKGLSLNLAGQQIDVSTNLLGLPTPDLAFLVKAGNLQLEPIAEAAMAKIPTALVGAYLDNLSVDGNYSTAKKTGVINIDFAGGRAANLPLGAAKATVALTPGATELKPSQLSIFGGNAKLSGSIRGEQTKSLDFGLNGSDFALEPITKFGDPNRSVYLTGSVSSISVRAESSNMADSTALHATVQVAAGQGTIEGINILGITLGKIGQLPGVGLTIESLIPEQYRHFLSASNTPFDSLTADVTLNGPTTTIRSAQLTHGLYLITGGGTLTGNNFDLDLQLRLTPELTSKMVERERHLNLLLDAGGNLQIPVRITRSNGTTLVYPDVSRLAKGAAINTTKEVVGKALDKIAPGLGGAGKALDQLFK